MSEILSIEGVKVKIGLDSGKVVTVPLAIIGYANPQAGDEVRLYKDGDETIVKKVAQQGAGAASSPIIQINNTNANANSITAPVGPAGRTVTINKIVYLVLTFLLGWLGVHRFMRGQVGIGILYLFTAGLLGWGVLIDFIIALTKLGQYDDDFVFSGGQWA